MTIILTNPDIVLYRGEDHARIAKEIEDFKTLRAAGFLVGRNLELFAEWTRLEHLERWANAVVTEMRERKQ